MCPSSGRPRGGPEAVWGYGQDARAREVSEAAPTCLLHGPMPALGLLRSWLLWGLSGQVVLGFFFRTLYGSKFPAPTWNPFSRARAPAFQPASWVPSALGTTSLEPAWSRPILIGVRLFSGMHSETLTQNDNTDPDTGMWPATHRRHQEGTLDQGCTLPAGESRRGRVGVSREAGFLSTQRAGRGPQHAAAQQADRATAP